MKIAGVRIEPVRYRLRRKLVTQHGTLSERRGFRVVLIDSADCEGCGESLPLGSAGTESLPECEAALGRLRESIGARSSSADELRTRIAPVLHRRPAAACALDQALLDLDARQRGLPLARSLGASPPYSVDVNALLGADPLAETLRVAEEALTRGYQTLKLKITSREEARARLEALRRLADSTASGIRIRIDANGAWTRQLALDILAEIARFDIELVEQPVAADDLEGLACVHRASPIPVAADESLALPEGRSAALDGKLASILVLKPMVLGGSSACASLAEAARRRGLRVLVTTTLEGPVGTAHAAHLACAIADRDLACGLNSCEHVEGLFPPELVPRSGKIQLGNAEGIGEVCEG
ncbi:MAG: mandelate racemase/muconate lactonizing enzyme family protein [Myxococcota bacterium]